MGVVKKRKKKKKKKKNLWTQGREAGENGNVNSANMWKKNKNNTKEPLEEEKPRALIMK